MKVGKTTCNPAKGNGTESSVTFGEFTISQFDDGGIWIEDGDDDAGSFDEALFIECIRKFYNENF